MVELDQLENYHDEFAARHVRLVAISPESVEETAALQKRYPHLLMISDHDHRLAQAAKVLGPHHSPDGQLTNAPTTIFLDRKGIIRWIYRPERYLTRLAAHVALAKVDESLQAH